MNRAEKRRNKKLAGKGAKTTKPIPVSSPMLAEQEQTRSIQQALDFAIQHHEAGDLPKAEGIYHQILQAYPNQPIALHFLGLIAHQLGKNDIALDLMSKALAIKPDYANAHSNLGNTLFELGRLDEAVTSYNKAITINPDHAEAYYSLGNALHDLGKIDEAVASYRTSLAIVPDNAEVYRNLSTKLWIHLGMGLRVIAYNNCRAVEQEITSANGDKKRNSTSDNDELWDEMLTCADRGLSLTPTDTEGLALKASALLGLNRSDEWADFSGFDRLIQTQTMSAPEGYADLKTFNKALLKRCTEDQNQIFEPHGQAITNGQRTKNLENDPEFSATSHLLEFINKSARHYCTNHPKDSQHPFLAQVTDKWRITAWGSVLNKQGHHSSHIHDSGWLSGVYYAKLPDVMEMENEKREGWIEFGRPINYAYNENSPEFHFVRPQEGLMILFPSYLYHQTIPFESDDTRFTVAFDLIPLP